VMSPGRPMVGPGKVHRGPWEARTCTDQSSATEGSLKVTLAMSQKGEW